MKFKVLLSTSFLALSFNLLAFNVTGDSFKSKFEITYLFAFIIKYKFMIRFCIDSL